MPAKLHSCVQKVMAQGHDEKSAWAICNARLNENASAEDIRERFALHNGVFELLSEMQPEAEAMSEQIAFEKFKALVPGKPLKILPVGRFYRGDRVLEIDDSRAKQMVANFNKGLPRFGVPINVEHGADSQQPGAVGAVRKLEFVPGQGVFATQVELTDVGKKLVEESRYTAPSPEVVWTLNGGARYQDPVSGEWFDNVMVGLALTNSPFFGGNVSVFSSKPKKEKFAMPNPQLPQPAAQPPPIAPAPGQFPEPGAQPQLTVVQPGQQPGMQPGMGMGMDAGLPALAELLQKLQMGVQAVARKFEEIMPNAFKPTEAGAPEPGGMKPAKPGEEAPEGDSEEEVPEDEEGMPEDEGEEEAPKDEGEEEPEEESGGDEPPPWLKKKAPASAKGEGMSGKIMDAETFAALQAKAAQVDQLSAQLKTVQDQFAVERQLRRTVEFVELAETFSALPGKKEDLGEHLLWLYDADNAGGKDKPHFDFFNALLQQANVIAQKSELFSTFGTAREAGEGEEAEPFLRQVETIRKERFNTVSQTEGFAAAFRAAEKDFPELARAYSASRYHRARR